MKQLAFVVSFLFFVFTGSVARSFADEGQEPTQLSNLQRAFYAQAFQSFVQQVQVGITQVHTATDAVPPPYDPSASRVGWVNAFTDAVVTQSHLSPADTATFQASVQNIFFGYFNNQPYGKVNFLTPVPSTNAEGSQVRSVKRIHLIDRYPSPHTMDLSTYVSQRFAEPLQDFIRKNHVPFYGHDSDCAEAIAYHRARGYSLVERYASQVDGPTSPNFIAYNPKSHAYVFAVCDLVGKDDVTRITEIVGPLFKSSKAYLVHHLSPEHLFSFNNAGQNFKFGPDDRVFIGYQNTVWWKLYTSSSQADWQRVALSDDGLETDLFYNHKTGQRIVSVANCYGDEMKMALEALYAKGARRFAYLGTAGGLDPSLRVGDVLIPTRFRFRPTGGTNAQIVSFDNTAMDLNLIPASGARIKLGSQQDWVPTLIEESVANVRSMRDAGSQAMDVESRYIGEFFVDHAATEKTVIITVSDLPLGGETYVDAGAHRGSDIQSVNAALSQILEN